LSNLKLHKMVGDTYACLMVRIWCVGLRLAGGADKKGKEWRNPSADPTRTARCVRVILRKMLGMVSFCSHFVDRSDASVAVLLRLEYGVVWLSSLFLIGHFNAVVRFSVQPHGGRPFEPQTK
jgi:hypothetical protein